MTTHQDDLYTVAARLDESPTEIMNGGAVAGLNALAVSAQAAEAAASAHGIEPTTVTALWERAGVRLRELPDANEMFPAAAEAATLLYAAAWVFDSDSVTAEGLQALM
ncbi:MAG TPA: hypothetical protein VGL54_00485 [Solirubrobacteraceae bacterium]|jgi:hypothetical protein